MATAHSNVNRATCAIIMMIKINLFLISGPVFPRRVRRRCPAIILAVNRIARVLGRIIFLISSIHTIKGIRRLGVPIGT